MAFFPAPSDTPQEVTIVDTTSTEITLQWKEVPCIEQNGDIIGYTVRYSISGSNITLRNYSDTVATLVDLIPFTNYSIEVAAFNVNGTGPFSSPVYMRTDGDSKWVYRYTEEPLLRTPLQLGHLCIKDTLLCPKYAFLQDISPGPQGVHNRGVAV